MVQSLTMTGLGIKLPGIVETLSGGNVTVALSIVAVVSIILGCGVSTLAVYILVAMVSAPKAAMGRTSSQRTRTVLSHSLARM